MKIARSPQELLSQSPSISIAIGFFDGVHLGHQSIIGSLLAASARTESSSVVVTFHHHPRAVLAPDKIPPLIYPFSKKMEILGQLGVQYVLLLDFDRRLSQLSPLEFLTHLQGESRSLKSVTVGSNFTFGRQRSGNLSTLRLMSEEKGFEVQGMEPVAAGNSVVSSTRIRSAIQAGKFEEAALCLGRPYRLCGRISRGDGLGKNLGFPTANLKLANLALPPTGVYQVRCAWGSCSTALGAMNIGYRPTLNQSTPSLQTEVHLLDIHADLYDQDFEVEFLKKIREEKKFASLEDLKSQIASDVAQIRAESQAPR